MCRVKVYILISFVIIGFCGFSQQKNELTQFMEQVDQMAPGQDKLTLLDSLSKQINELKWSDTKFYKEHYSKYALQHIDLAKQLDSIDLAAFRTSRLTYHYLNIINLPDSALVIVNNIIPDSNKIKKRINLGHLYIKRAAAFYQIDNLEKAIVDYEKAERTYHQTRDTIFEADALYFNGQATERLGRLSEAILKYQKANELYAKMKDTAYVAYTGLAISGIFSQLYLLDKSFEERQKIRELLNQQQQKDIVALSELKINDSRDYVKRKEYEKQGEALLEALSLVAKDEKLGVNRFRLRGYLSKFYSKRGQLEVAKKYLDTLEMFPDLINSPYDKMFYLQAASEYELASERYQNAIPYLKELLEMFKKSNDLQSQVYVEKELHKAHQGTQNFAEASKHLERHVLLKDSLYNIRRSNSIIYYRTLYEIEKKESKIAAQNANISMLEEKNKAKRNLMIFGGVGLSLLFLSIYLYRNRVFLLRNKKLQQSFLQELLQTQERVSKRISKDLHDSVGQSLLLIKNRVMQSKDEQTAKVVDNVIDEVRSISRSLHPFKLEELGLTVTLESSVEMIDENYDIFISADIDNIDQVFDPEKEINIYRLVQESFNNILKHSNARSAEIRVNNKENDVEIVIKDNGKGFDVSQEKTAISKIGLKTLSERSKFLKASFKILSEIDQGTTLIFKIPKYA